MGRLEADAQEPAGRAEVVRDEDSALVADNRDRPRDVSPTSVLEGRGRARRRGLTACGWCTRSSRAGAARAESPIAWSGVVACSYPAGH
jgi:hypothetical protein